MYLGYLIKIKGVEGTSASSDYEIPMQFVQEKSYKGTYSTLDKDSKRTSSGKLKRKVLSHKVAHSAVQTRPLWYTDLHNLMQNIQQRYVKPKEKKVRASIWVVEICDYVETEFYVPDTEYTIDHIEGTSIKYEPFTLELIGY